MSFGIDLLFFAWGTTLGSLFALNLLSWCENLSLQTSIWGLCHCVPQVLAWCQHSHLIIPIVLTSSLVFSVTHWLCRRVLLNFHLLMEFLQILLTFISNFIVLWSGRMHGIISVSLQFLNHFLWGIVVAVVVLVAGIMLSTSCFPGRSEVQCMVYFREHFLCSRDCVSWCLCVGNTL